MCIWQRLNGLNCVVNTQLIKGNADIDSLDVVRSKTEVISSRNDFYVTKSHANRIHDEFRMNLDICIKVISYILEIFDCITCDETKPFVHKLQSIMEQIDTSKVPEEQKVSILV